MPFRPNIDDTLTIEGASYRVVEHPSAAGLPYGQEGRQGVVYQLQAANGGYYALKVFKSQFRKPALVTLTSRLEAFADIRGLEVCRRVILSPRFHASLLRQHPDLMYAVLMPWVAGPTWMDVVLESRPLSVDQSLTLARALAGLLTEMEEQGLAHCDLSAPNLLLPRLASESGVSVALVDIEQMYGPELDRPLQIPAGSAGYAHKTASVGLWNAEADRFAGALLLSEILGWCDEQVRQAANGESYFDPSEIQRPSARYDVLRASLERRWGSGIARLLERAWASDTLADCPSCGEWLVALPETPAAASSVQAAPMPAAPPAPIDGARALLELASMLRGQGNRDGALTAYRRALDLLAPGDALASEVRLLIADLDHGTAVKPTAPQPAPTRTSEADQQPSRRRMWPLALLLIVILGLIASTAGFFQVQAAQHASATTAAQAQLAQAATTAQAQQVALAATTQAETTATARADLTSTAQVAATRVMAAQVMAQQEQTATAQLAATATALVTAQQAHGTATASAAQATQQAQTAAQAAQETQQAQATAAQAAQATQQAKAAAQAAQETQQAQAAAAQAAQATQQAQAAAQAAQATQQATPKGEISNFRIVEEGSSRLVFAVDYSYSGPPANLSLGSECPSWQIIDVMCNISSANIAPGHGTAQVQIDYENRGLTTSFTSNSIEATIIRWEGNSGYPVAQVKFSYTKTWSP
jgi:hypothetical protein